MAHTAVHSAIEKFRDRPKPGKRQTILQFEREKLLEEFRDRPQLQQLEGAPEGTLITQTGQIISAAPDPGLFDVSEQEAAFEIEDFLGQLAQRSEAIEPIVARRAFAGPGGRGLGISGIAELASRRAVASERARLEQETTVAIGASRQDVLRERQAREVNRQRLQDLALREEREFEEAARFELGLGLEDIRQREQNQLARELAELQVSVAREGQLAQRRLEIQRIEAEKQAKWESEQNFDPFFWTHG